MGKKLTPEQLVDHELDLAFAEFQGLNKSRRDGGGNAAPEFNEEPALPQNMGGQSTREQRKDNRGYVDTQYGDTEPEDPEDEEATRRAAARQRRIFSEENDEDLAASQAGRRKDEEDEEDEEEFEKAMRFYHRWKKSQRDAATRAIEAGQESYLREQRGDDDEGGNEDDDVHGEPEDFPDGRFGMPDPDDQTQITNMGRRVRGAGSARKSLGGSQDFYQEVIGTTDYDAEIWNVNPGLAAIADVVGRYLDKSATVITRLAQELRKSNARVQRMEAQLAKSLTSQAVILRQNRELSKSMAVIEEQPIDFAPSGVVLWPGARTARDAQPAQRGGRKGGKPPALTKSVVKGKLTKAMRAGQIDPAMLVDFDNAMTKQTPLAQWVETAFDEDQRAALGL